MPAVSLTTVSASSARRLLAYGFLGLVKGQRDFLRHIPVAATRLREIAVDRGAAPALAPILKLRVLEVA